MCSCGGRNTRNLMRRRRPIIVTQQQMSAKKKNVRPSVVKREKDDGSISLERREILRKHRLAVQRALGK